MTSLAHSKPSVPGSVDTQVLQLFPTPVLRYRIPGADELNAQIRDVLLARMKSSPGVIQTNRGGWHSKADLHTWPEAPIQTFLARLREALAELVRQTVENPAPDHMDRWQITGWANVNRQGSYNKQHHHDGFGVLWSSFYYVDTGESYPGEDVGGSTVFQDRSGVPKEILRNPDPFSREIRVRPEPGLLFVFPGRLYHHVEAYHGQRLRMTLAFNMKHPGFVVPYYEDMIEPSWWWANFRGLMLLKQKVPERFRALASMPSKWATPSAAQLRGIARLRNAWDQATAEASRGADETWGRATPAPQVRSDR